MEAFFGYAALFLLIAALIIYPLYFRNVRLFLRLLEKELPHSWDELDRPRLDASINVRSSWLLIRYIWLGDYKDTSSQQLAKYGDRSKILLILGLVVFSLLITLGLLGS